MKTIHYILLVVFCSTLNAQEVSISDELNIRRDFAYDVVGEINDRILLYRDGHEKKQISVFNEDLEFIYDRELKMEDDRVDVHGFVAYDSCFHLVYTYASDSVRTVMKKYDETATALDTIELITLSNRYRSAKYKMVESVDKTKSLLFHLDIKEGFNFFLLDHDSMKVVQTRNLLIEDKNIYDDFLGITVSNDGMAFLLLEKNNRKFSKENHYFYLICLDLYTGEFLEEKIFFSNYLSIDIESAFDEKNKIFKFIGLYSDRESLHAQGMFSYTKNFRKDLEESVLKIQSFDQEFLNDIYKSEERDKLEYHKIKALKFTQDGGYVLFTEYDKTFSRRTPFQGYSQSSSIGSGRGWMDHYLEEVLVLAFSPTDEFRWKNIILKKQFSQDDSGVFSSFFLFALPSRLRLIFNDDIRNNNLVSEFDISPSGKTNRKSLLSTEYQNLKLRFSGAMQLSNDSFIVPSEKSNKLKLVKVSYK